MIENSIWAMDREGVVTLARRLEEIPVAEFADLNEEVETDTQLLEKDGKLGKIEVSGVIMPKMTGLMRLLGGGTGVNDISAALEEAEEREDIEQVLMTFDSPGGKAIGLPSLSQQIRSMDTPTLSYAQGQMLSAAYWIGSSADTVLASPNAMVGSIGVYSVLTSVSELQEEVGIETQVIKSTKLKGVEHPAEPINEESVKKTQRIVDKMHDGFAQAVATNQNLSKEYVMSEMADGDVRVGEEGEEDFVDGTATLDEVFSAFEYDEDSDLSREEQENQFLRSKVSEQSDRISDLESTVEGLKSSLSGMKEEQQESKIDQIVTKAIEEDQKFPPAKEDELREMLAEDFDSAKRMIDMTPEGAAGPSESLETEDEDQGDGEAKAEELASRGLIPAHSEQEADALSEIGEEYSDGEGDYFLVYEAEKYDVDVD